MLAGLWPEIRDLKLVGNGAGNVDHALTLSDACRPVSAPLALAWTSPEVSTPTRRAIEAGFRFFLAENQRSTAFGISATILLRIDWLSCLIGALLW
jgi:hypothetical protein